MNFQSFRAGLEILAPYFNDPAGYHIGAEHDQFYVYATDRPLSADDLAKMRALGWFQPDVEDGDPPAYEPEDGWSAFT